MPQVLKGNIEYDKHRYPWKEYFDGKARVFKFKKDFDNKNSFVSTVHQAAKRAGLHAMTVGQGKDVKVQALGKIEKNGRKTAKAKPAAKKAAKPKAKPAKRKASVRLPKGVSAEQMDASVN